MLRRPAILVLVALACALASAAVYAAAVGTGWAARADADALGWFTARQGTRLDGLAGDVVRLLDPRAYALLAAALAALALARGRLRHAIAAVGVLAGAALASQLLKPLLAAPRSHDAPLGAHVAEASWPSSHATGAVALALCLVLIAPPRLRPAAAVAGGAAAVVVACSVLHLGSHYPSDVLGGALVALACAALGARRAAGDRRPGAGDPAPHGGPAGRRRSRSRAPPPPSPWCSPGPAARSPSRREHTAVCAAAVPLAAAGLALVGSAAGQLSRG